MALCLFLSIIQIIMEQNSNSTLKNLLLRFFLKSNATPPYLQTVQSCFEAVLYVSVIYGFPLGSSLFSPHAVNIAISLMLLGLILARLFAGLSLVKFVYIPIVSYALTVGDSACIAFLTIIGLLLVVDVLSSISFDFYSQNLASESLNQCKLLHLAAILFGVSQAILGKGFIAAGISSGIFVGVWLYKRSSICRSRPHKELQLMLYLWFAASHLMVMTSNWLSLPLLLRLAIPMGLAQAVLKVYLSKRGSNSLDQLYSQQNYLKMAFELMIYLHGETFNPNMDKQIQAFLADPQYHSLRDSDRRRLVYQKLIEILARRNAYHQQLISCQIFLFYNHQLLKAKALLVRMQQAVGWSSWMKKICLFRVEETLREVYLQKNQEIHFANYEQYYRCDHFRSMLLRSSTAFISLWEYTRRPEIDSSKLRQLADRLVRFQRTLKQQFTEIQPKCLTLSLLYVSYLLQVARDSTQANGILQGLAFNEDFEVNLQLDQKLFAQVSLEGEAMAFQRVGHNASLLVGFQKKQLEGQKIDLLLPQFYRKFHNKYVNDCFQREFPRLYLYCKKTIVRNRWGYYEECNVMLRLHFSEQGDLVLRGYLQVKPNHNYSWTHFLFLTENEEIIQCAQSFSDYAPTSTRLHRAAEIFSDVRLYRPLVQKTAQGLVQYHPLLVFETDTQKVLYYVRVSQAQNGEISEGKEREGVMQLLQTMQLRKFQWNFIKNYYLRAQQLLANIYAKQYLLLAIVTFLCIGGLLACLGFFFNSATSQSKVEQSTMQTVRQVLSYYDSSIALGMRIVYIGLRRGYNYSNTISSNNALNLALILQTNNQKLKAFTKNRYALPSLLPNVTYQKPNYDMIVQLLSNSYMIRQFLDDSFLQSTVLSRAQLSLPAIFGNSLGEYQANFVESVKEVDQNTGQSLAIVSTIVLLLVICVIVVRAQFRLRRDEQETLSLISSVHQQEELINTTRNFISKITREDSSLLRYETDQKAKNIIYNNSFAPDSTNREKDASASRSEMSLREISGRDLLGDSFNRSGVLQTVVTSRLQPAPMQSFANHSQQIQVTPRKRWLLGVALGLIITVGAISLANQVQFNMNGQINLYSSVTSIFTLFSTGTIFSRSMILFLNLLGLRSSGPINTTEFDSFMSTFSKTQTLVTFPQGQFPQFSPFQQALNEMSFQFMCTYVNCDPDFASEINIIYTTTIQKIISSALTLKTQLNSMNVSTLIASVKNGTLARFIDLIYYSQLTIRTQLERVIYLYIDCFAEYSNNLMLKKQAMMAAAITTALLGLLALILLLIYAVKHQGLLRDIAGLLKTDSYINEDNQISDKEAARPSSDVQK